MKVSTKKRRIYLRNELRKLFVKDTLRAIAIANANAGKLGLYRFGRVINVVKRKESSDGVLSRIKTNPAFTEEESLLGALADKAKASADRASEAVDAMLDFVKQSELRIERMESAAIKAMIEKGRA